MGADIVEINRKCFSTSYLGVYNLLFLVKSEGDKVSEILKDKYIIIWSGSKKMKHIIDNKEISIPTNHFVYLPVNTNQTFLAININVHAFIFMFKEELYAQTWAELITLQNSTLFTKKENVDIILNNISNEIIFKHVFIDSILNCIDNTKYALRLQRNIIERIILNGKLEYSDSEIEVKENDFNAILAVKFKELLEKKFKEEHKVSYYENSLFVTKRTLDNATLKIYNKKAKKMIVDELIKEAKILLTHTNMQIKDIAMKLNFQQETNFTAFFKKNTGTTPKVYRENNKS